MWLLKKSVLTLADCEWRAAAAVLKRLRLPRAPMAITLTFENFYQFAFFKDSFAEGFGNSEHVYISCVCVCVCLSVCLSVCLYLSACICLSVCVPPPRGFATMSICVCLVSLSVCECVYLSACLSVCVPSQTALATVSISVCLVSVSVPV